MNLNFKETAQEVVRAVAVAGSLLAAGSTLDACTAAIYFDKGPVSHETKPIVSTERAEIHNRITACTNQLCSVEYDLCKRGGPGVHGDQIVIGTNTSDVLDACSAAARTCLDQQGCH